MTYITYHSLKHLALEKALAEAGKGQTIYVYIGESSLSYGWYEVHDSPLIKVEDSYNAEYKLLLVIPAFDMFNRPNKKSIGIINKIYRIESPTYAKQAINRARRWRYEGGVFDANYSYIGFLEQELSDIANKR
jgi:hypothetical protein